MGTYEGMGNGESADGTKSDSVDGLESRIRECDDMIYGSWRSCFPGFGETIDTGLPSLAASMIRRESMNEKIEMVD